MPHGRRSWPAKTIIRSPGATQTSAVPRRPGVAAVTHLADLWTLHRVRFGVLQGAGERTRCGPASAVCQRGRASAPSCTPAPASITKMWPEPMIVAGDSEGRFEGQPLPC